MTYSDSMHSFVPPGENHRVASVATCVASGAQWFAAALRNHWGLPDIC